MPEPEPSTTRRGFFGVVGAGLGLDATRGRTIDFWPETDTTAALDVQSSSFEVRYPTEVVDSFLDGAATTPYLLGRSGWASVTVEQQIQTIRRLHTERLDTHANLGAFFRPPSAMTAGPATVQGHFSRDVSVPVGGQQHLQPSVEGWTRWYQHRPESTRWTDDDGSVIDGVLDFAAERFDGEPRIKEDFGVAVPSLFFDRFRQYVTDAATTFLAHGYAHVYLDNAQAPTFRGLDYSAWATSAFRDHLQGLSDARLEALGVEEPGTFDLREHLENESLSPGDADTPFTDPAAREYKRHQLRAHRDYLWRYRDGIHESFPERSADDGISVVGNVGMDIPRPTAVVVADAFDAVHGESEQTVPGTKILDWKHKLADAAGRFDRPVVSVGSMITRGGFSTSTAEGLDAAKEYPTLQNLQVAEAFANGARRSLSLAGWGMNDDWAVDNWVRTDGSVPDPLQSFLDYCWANRPYLTDAEPANDVALVYSLPTAVWDRAPEWGRYHPTHIRAFQGAATLLRRHQLPYDVVVFGLPGVWDDSEQLDRLRDYRTVLLPAIDAVSDDQVAAIRDAIEGGSGVVVTGGAATLDDDRQPRDDFESLLADHEAATVVDGTPGLAVHEDRAPSTDLEESLTATGRQVEVDAPGVVVTVRHQSDAGRSVVHFLNYDWNRVDDSVPGHSDVDVSLDVPTDANAARWVTPSGNHAVATNTADGRVETTLPSLELHGLLVLAGDESALDRSDTAGAREAIDAARAAIEEASGTGRDHHGLDVARAELANAEAAIDREAPDIATEAANEAASAASAAIEPPVVGIDQAHGQGASDDWSTFEPLRTRFDRYEYLEVTDWSAQTLAAVDLLVVPPVVSDQYDFETTELDRLAAFVEAGGRVVVLGEPNVASDHTALTDRYGFGFDGDPLVQLRQSFGRLGTDRVDPAEIDARGVPSTLTQFAISFRTAQATPMTVANDQVETLGYVHEEGGAFVNRSGARDTRDPDDEDAAGLPLIVARAVGDGYVAGIGTAEHFRSPTQGEDGGRTGSQDDALVTSLLRTATGGEVTKADLPATSGATSSTGTAPQEESADPESPQDDEAAASPGVPGFGVGETLGGLVGAAALFRWLHSDD